MIFSITAVDEHRQRRYFSYMLGSLEANLNFVDAIRAMGHTLIQVRLLEQSGVTDLSPESFDDVPASSTLEHLETEWKTILNT